MAEELQPRTARLSVPIGDDDHVQGPATAPVTLVEYGDYECPYCRAAVPIVEELRRLLGDQLRYVFRHFPLTDLHPHAQHAAEAAEAAGGQGKYFEMHATLFEHQESLTDRDLVRYAADIGLDGDRVGSELRSHVHADQVREDVESGLQSGVRGTPTFFLDEVRYDGLLGVQQLIDAIRDSHPDVVTEAVEAESGRGPIPRVVQQRSSLRPPRP